MATKLHSTSAAGSRHGVHQLTYPDAADRVAGANEGTGATPKDFDLAKQDDDDSLWLLTSAAGPTWEMLWSPFLEEVFLPILWGLDGAAPPDANETITDGSGSAEVRKFDDASTEDLVIPWQVPADIVAGSGITFSAVGIITEATPPASGEGVVFKLSGYSIGTGDALDGTFGTEVASSDADLFASGCTARYDIFRTTESTAVTVTGLAAGEIAMLHFERDVAEADDDYAQDVGIIGVVVKYSRKLSL